MCDDGVDPLIWLINGSNGISLKKMEKTFVDTWKEVKVAHYMFPKESLVALLSIMDQIQ